MTYCVGIKTHQGLLLASDSRSNAGIDQVDVCRKMASFVVPGERVFVILCSGTLSLSQSIVTLLQEEFDSGEGLATAATFYAAVRCVGEQVRRIANLDRPTLERDGLAFNVHLIVGGQIKGQSPELYLVYPQGNPLRATPESPFLQIGESKYGRPILDRCIRFSETTLDDAAKYALISIDSTMRSNMAVGPPIDLVSYRDGELRLDRRLRLAADDPALATMRAQWEHDLRQAIHNMPRLPFGD